MTERQVKLIFGVFLALVAAYAGVQLLGGRGGGGGGRLGLEAAVDGPPRLVRVLESGGDSLRLELRDGAGRVNGFPADSAQLASLFAALDSTRAGELVSRSESNHDRLGVTEKAADRVAIGPADSPSFIFLLGKSGRGGRFVRRPNSEETYLLDGPAASLLGRSVETWRNREVAAVDTGRVGRIVLERGGRRTTLVRGERGWRTAAGDSADASRVASLLRELADLRAAGDVPADSVIRSADFTSPDAVLRVMPSSAEGEEPTLTLRVVRVAENGPYLTRRQGRPYTYSLAGYQYDQLFPARSDLLPGESQ